MDHSRHEVARGIWLDARRALWLEEARVLAVADLHMGYAWAHRHTGQLMPITVPDDAVDRLSALQREYRAEQIVLLGDIVHRAVPVAPLREELTRLLNCFTDGVRLTLVMGNHDRDLERLTGESTRFRGHSNIQNCLFLHGDRDSTTIAAEAIRSAEQTGDWIIMGHEHPSITLGDGVATWEKYPCFLICDRVIVLPAFSRWAAGNGHDEYMSPLLECRTIRSKIAILGDRLVPIRSD
jgi:putative SbcD/Mre11-related phosphoesterase